VYCNIIYTFVNIQTKFTHYVLIIMVVVFCMFYFPNISEPYVVVECFALLLHIQDVPHSNVGMKPRQMAYYQKLGFYCCLLYLFQIPLITLLFNTIYSEILRVLSKW